MQERFYNRHVSVFVQEPRLMEELLSFEKSMARFWGFDGQYTGLEIQSIT